MEERKIVTWLAMRQIPSEGDSLRHRVAWGGGDTSQNLLSPREDRRRWSVLVGKL